MIMQNVCQFSEGLLWDFVKVFVMDGSSENMTSLQTWDGLNENDSMLTLQIWVSNGKFEKSILHPTPKFIRFANL